MHVLLRFWISAKILDGAGVKVRDMLGDLSDVEMADEKLIESIEDWGEDHILTSHMGVAFASGLSKNSSWSAPDAVVPVMKVELDPVLLPSEAEGPLSILLHMVRHNLD